LQAVRVVALAHLAYFGVEFAVATSIASVSLFADSVDFLEDAAVNWLILLGPGWSQRKRARLGMALVPVLLLPGVATLWTASGGNHAADPRSGGTASLTRPDVLPEILMTRRQRREGEGGIQTSR
jgi:hypothetical protein